VSTPDAFRIEAVALDLARIIAAENSFEAPQKAQDIARELLLAVVSSRVRWEVACAIVGDLMSIVYAGSGWRFDLHQAVPSAVARHRHPRRVARWIKALFADDRRSLRLALDMLTAPEEPVLVRRRLVAEVAGLGPKQASLLLRNLGRGQRLAVLDRHVMRFMQLLGMSATAGYVASIAAYERMEATFVGYADYRRVSADALDLAVWVVMRSAWGSVVREHRDTGIRRARLDADGCSGIGDGPDAVSSIH
jgi:thermostable 8-oxoguanine DNA glycosylase